MWKAACNDGFAPHNPRVEKAMPYLLVGLGSALGGMGRFWLSGLITQRFGEGFPWGTLFVNVTGSFLIGFLAAFGESGGRTGSRPPAVVGQFFMAGICGGYTTFSAFSLQTLRLAQNGEWPQAVMNSAASVGLCLAAVWLGFLAGQLAVRR